MTYAPGSNVRVSAIFTKAGLPVDPQAVHLSISDPLGGTSTYTYGADAQLVRDAEGSYHAGLSGVIEGRYIHSWTTTGPDLSGSGQFFVALPSTTEGVAAVEVTNGGSGYTTPPDVSFSGGNGSGAQAIAIVPGAGGSGATATATLVGSLAGIDLTAFGSGYTSSPSVGLSGGGGSGAIAEAVISPGIASVSVNNPGSGYNTPTATVTGTPAPTNAAVGYPVIQDSGDGTGVVNRMLWADTGSGYAAATNYGVNISGGGGSGASLSALSGTTANGVRSIAVTSGGSGYVSVPNVSLSGGGGSGAKAVATIDSSGHVNAIYILNPGDNYTTAPAVSFSGGGGSGSTATATIATGCIIGIGTGFAAGSGYSVPIIEIVGAGTGAHYLAEAFNGQVLDAVQNQTGSAYPSAVGSSYLGTPIARIFGGGGSGATATPNVGGPLTAINLANPGSGYTSPPLVSLSGGGGAKARAIIGSPVASLAITAGGSDYTSAPQVVISAPPSGRTATATATIVNGVVIGLTLTDPGSGYIDPPTVTFISDQVAAVNVTDPGSGYDSPPAVAFSSGTVSAVAVLGVLGTDTLSLSDTAI